MALLGTAPGLASAARSSAAPVSVRSYSASTAVIANPDRGFYHYTESHARLDGSGAAPLDLATLRTWRVQQSVTVVYHVYYLERFVDRPLDLALLAQVAADLATARAAGVKLVLRFAYSDSSGADAGLGLVLRHIDQLAPVLAADRDVVLVLQAGFVGRWGEWYYSDHFTDDPAHPWLLSATSWTRRTAVLRQLLSVLPRSIPVQVRYPEIKDRLRASDPQLVADRLVGVHDDCFVADETDAGTFARPTDRAWLASETRRAPMGGETCRANPPRSSWPSAQADLAAYHWSFLNADYAPEVLASWGEAGRAEVERRLGYRVRLSWTSCPVSAAAGSPFRFRAELVNDGYASAFGSYEATLVLRSGTTTVERPLPLDLRTVAPGRVTALEATVVAPPTPGRYALALRLRPRSTGSAEPAGLSVRLANDGTWSPVPGWNDLQQTVTVPSS